MSYLLKILYSFIIRGITLYEIEIMFIERVALKWITSVKGVFSLTLSTTADLESGMSRE